VDVYCTFKWKNYNIIKGEKEMHENYQLHDPDNCQNRAYIDAIRDDLSEIKEQGIIRHKEIMGILHAHDAMLRGNGQPGIRADINTLKIRHNADITSIKTKQKWQWGLTLAGISAGAVAIFLLLVELI
jgi:hypothetical protein